MSRILAPLSAIMAWIDKFLVFLSVVAICALAVVTFTDVFMRYLFNSPLPFAYNLVVMYLFPFSVLLMLSDNFKQNENISIDLLVGRWSTRTWRVVTALGEVVTIPVFGYIAIIYLGSARDAFIKGEVVFGAISWPTWPPHAAVCIGFATLTVRLLISLLEHLAGISLRPDNAAVIED